MWSSRTSAVSMPPSPPGFTDHITGSTFSDDGSMEKDNPISLCFEAIGKGMTKIGRPPAQVAKMKEHLENAGFIDIKV